MIFCNIPEEANNNTLRDVPGKEYGSCMVLILITCYCYYHYFLFIYYFNCYYCNYPIFFHMNSAIDKEPSFLALSLEKEIYLPNPSRPPLPFYVLIISVSLSLFYRLCVKLSLIYYILAPSCKIINVFI